MINFNGLKVSALSALALGLMLVNLQPSQAQNNFRQNHPRRAEVLRRDNRMNGAINRDRGQLGGNYGALKAEQRGIRQQERLDAQANGGHITRQEQRQLNGEENTLHQQVSQDYNGQGNAFGRGHGRGGWGNGGGNGGGGWGNGGGNGGGGWGNGGGGQFAYNHPRRAEVLGRDGNLNRDINQDRGQLGGNYQALKADDRSIRQQEQADARANGGYITQQQKQQLNQEENQLKNQIGQDHR